MTAPNRLSPERSSVEQKKPKTLKPFNTTDIKILLLENVNATAVKILTQAGYQVRRIPIHRKEKQ